MDKLDSIKSTILALAEYCQDFDRSVTLHKDFVQQWEGIPKLKISTMKQAYGGKNNNDVDDYDIKLWYYSYGEYKKLTPQQKRNLKTLHE